MPALPLLLLALAGSAASDSLCAVHTEHADPSLYCFPLISTDRAPSAFGTAVLRLEPGPFGLAVTPDGRLRYRLALTLSGLPDPERLGPYRALVAWATTPELEPMIPLGPVRNGRTLTGPIALERLLIMVSAEPAASAQKRKGPLLLRGSSPSLLMVPHGVTALPPQSGSTHPHDSGRWTMPAMHPKVARMPFGLERLQPRATPYLPHGSGSLPPAGKSRVHRLADADTIALTARKVRGVVRGGSVVMYAYNGQIPGPRLELTKGATITVRFRNETDLPGSIHWHGLRLANPNDGVPGVTQPPVPPGGEFVYRVHAPDAGIFWYHPHHRADITQDLGLAGNIVVRHRADRPPARREAFLLLDDLLLDGNALFPYGRESATHALMGRFGNALLVNGSEVWRGEGRTGEPVRLFLTNAASARTFNLSIEGAQLRVIGSDGGAYAAPRPARSVVIAPSERYVVEARFGRAGRYALVNRVRGIDRVAGRFFGEVDTLGFLTIHGSQAGLAEFHPGPEHDSLAAEARTHRHRRPDRTIVLSLRTGTLPFALIQALRLDTAFVQPVEWTSTMPMMDWLSTAEEVAWVLRDSLSGAEGMELDWRAPRNKPLVVRLVNDKHVLHPMGHPIHLHGQRFLVLNRNGVPNNDLLWKDTVLVPAGGTVDLLIDTSNPGRWMLHCHIAEHLESGMHTILTIE